MSPRSFGRTLSIALAAALLAAGSLACSRPDAASAPATRQPPAAPAPAVPLYSTGFIDDSGYDLALSFTPYIADRSSLPETAAAIQARTRVGIEQVTSRLGAPPPPGVDAAEFRSRGHLYLGLLHLYEGRFAEADTELSQAAAEPGLTAKLKANLTALRGVAALRRGEIENCVACVGPSSCIYPLDARAVHQFPDGAHQAIGCFNQYLQQRPDDLGVRWLLHIAVAAAGADPTSVPPRLRIDPGSLRGSDGPDPGRFDNIALTAGLNARGPNMLGGVAFDDFNGDGRPDLFISSGDWDLDPSLFLNHGDGTFAEPEKPRGLQDQGGAVNVAHADFDADGRLDVLLLRGGWETPYRLSLLRNVGSGQFDDVTVSAGLDLPIATQSAAWADFDLDGDLDLFVAGEYHERPVDPRNRCRLYRNNADGTFTDIAAQAGVINERWAKGATWGDYDADGDPDLYISNANSPNRLYRNHADGTFTDVAPELDLTEPIGSFSCWFFDHDDDGHLDLFVAGFRAHLHDLVADMLGQSADGERPRLYRNRGDGHFDDVTAAAGLDRVWIPMGSNFGDIDNDGDLDIYLATGRPAYSTLVPNVLLLNEHGRFREATTPSGTGHLQKGHGVALADHDADGDLDLFVQTGGQVPGDRAHNVLFLNPGHRGNWLEVRLEGARGNRSALGARLEARVTGADGSTRSLHRIVTPGSSYGGNPLSVWFGLARATRIDSLTIHWPGAAMPQLVGPLEAGRTHTVRQQPSIAPTAAKTP